LWNPHVAVSVVLHCQIHACFHFVDVILWLYFPVADRSGPLANVRRAMATLVAPRTLVCRFTLVSLIIFIGAAIIGRP
jgi:hypothetical protein